MDPANLATSFLDQTSRSLSYLNAVPASYFVDKIAFAFRVIAVLILLPPIFLALLDITAYVIARTLQAPKDRPRSPGTAAPVSTSSAPGAAETESLRLSHFPPPGLEAPDTPGPNDSPSETSFLTDGHRTHSASSLTARLGRPAQRGEPIWFPFPIPINTNASEALSGVGIFSPPISRSTTPSKEFPIHAGNDGSDGTILGGGVPSSLKMTPAAPVGSTSTSGSVIIGGSRSSKPPPSLMSVLDSPPSPTT